MICEKCSHDIDGTTCSNCGGAVVMLGPFCYLCGAKLDRHAEAYGQVGGNGSGEEDCSETDFSKRVLCSDGTCIGVINDQGVCKVCGKPYTEEP